LNAAKNRVPILREIRVVHALDIVWLIAVFWNLKYGPVSEMAAALYKFDWLL
jgi:hypothetical protein